MRGVADGTHSHNQVAKKQELEKVVAAFSSYSRFARLLFCFSFCPSRASRAPRCAGRGHGRWLWWDF